MDKILYAVAYWGVAIFLIAYIIRARKLETEIGLTIKKILFSGLFVVLIYSITFTSDHLLFFYIGESIGFIAKDYMLYLMLCYTRLFSGVHIKEKKKNLLIIILFSIDAIILLINPFTNIAFSSRQVVVDSLTYYVIEPHLLYYYHIWAAYAVGILILLILLEKIVTTPREYRKKYAMVMLGFLFVMILNFIYIRTGLFMDISIIGLAVAVCLLFYFAVDYQPNIIISKMHKIIIDGTENPMLFFDYETNLVTVNRSARDVFDLPEDYHNNLLNFMEEFDLIGDVALEDNCKFIRCVKRGQVSSWYQIQYKDLRNQHDQYLGSLLVFNDITQEHELMENLEYSAIHEQLTGLYNTSYYNQQMKEFEKDENMPLAIALWNINGLKMMNDFYGNERANQAVKVVAKCIKRGLHEGDIAIRMYGDETMVIMKNTFEKEAVSRMNKISRWIHSNKDAGFYISAEFGVAVKMIATDSIEECLTSARNTMYQKKMLNQDSVRSSILNSLKSSLRESDFETEQHAERTSTMAIELGKRLGLDDRELGELSLVSVLHDIGKLSIPDNILQKAQKLDDEEWEIMKNHTIKGYELAKISPELEGIADAILHHHEKWDGTGYPSGLREEEIPLNSRIITVVDSFDVMTHDRPYHTAITVKQAKEKLIQCAGTQFDPMIVKTFLQMLESQNKLSIGG